MKPMVKMPRKITIDQKPKIPIPPSDTAQAVGVADPGAPREMVGADVEFVAVVAERRVGQIVVLDAGSDHPGQRVRRCDRRVP